MSFPLPWFNLAWTRWSGCREGHADSQAFHLPFPFLLPMAVTRFLCDLGGELQVGPVHKHPAARLADVCHLGQCARRGPAWLPAAPTPIHYADLVSVLVLCSVSHVCSSDSPPWSTWYMQVPWAFREGRPDSQEELQGILKAEEESVPHPLYPCRFHVPGRRENA